jgi:SsrA-binding protein
MADIKHAYGRIENNEVFLYNFHISKYPFSHEKFDPKRPKKLLLHKREIHRLIGKIKEKRQTLIPLKLYFTNHGYAKVELALVKGKKLKDRREEIKKKITDREIKEYLLR